MDDAATKDYGTTLLRARRLVERNVRFIQVVTGPIEVPGNEQAINWDAHQELEKNHGAHAKVVDKPIAGCLPI